MITRIASWYHARQRAMDLELLWPVCREQAEDIDDARGVFAVHCFMDPAWRCLGDDEIWRRVGQLH